MTEWNEPEEILSLDEQIRLKRREIALSRKEEKERKLAEDKEQPKHRKKAGRKKLDQEIIKKAWKLAETNSLPDVALKLNVSLKSLYNHGINRKSVDERIKLREKFEPTLEIIKTFAYLIESIVNKFTQRKDCERK